MISDTILFRTKQSINNLLTRIRESNDLSINNDDQCNTDDKESMAIPEGKIH